ncbi:MAG TPA: ABC transporter substrate-binding protein [Mycobacteriales bacterium]|nr:ABC transporter substrate-binding protein [Mycobacteriales bacterium]
MRTPRAVAIVLLLGLLISACGSRLNDQTRQQAAAAYLRTGSGAGPASSGGLDNQAGGQLPGAVSNNGGPVTNTNTGTNTGAGAVGPGNTGSTKTGTTKSGGTAPQQQQQAGTSCPTSGTDTGLTSNQVSFGTIASTTGPVAGLFEGAIQGEQAFRAFANSTGGICGHAVNVVAADDGTNCNQNQNATQNMASRIFAFVGSFSLYDGCGAAYIKQHNIPDLHVQLDPRAGEPASHYDVEPGPLGYTTGPFAYYAKKYPSAVKAVGTLFPNIPSAVQKQHAFVKAANSVGWKFVYSRAADATETDWTSDFVKMCGQQHIKIFFTSAENAQNAAKMIQNESQAGCPKSLINIIPIAYDQAFVADVGDTSKIEGMMGWNEFSLFFNKDEAQRIPELQQLQTWFQRVNGNKPLNLYALFAWAEGRLFQQAFENAGPTINRKTLLAALAKIHKFDANGIVAPVDPGSKTEGVNCYLLWNFSHGAFHRMDSPATGYRCDGKFMPLNG